MSKRCPHPTTNATLNDPRLLTVNRRVVPGSAGDWTRHNPWRAPGRAPVLDSCGMAGGWHRQEGGEAK